MIQLCNSLQSHLASKRLYPSLQAVLTRGLVRIRPVLKRASLMALANLAIRPLVSSQFSPPVLNLFLVHILSVPALLHFLSTMAVEALQLFVTNKVFLHTLEYLKEEQNMRAVFTLLEGNYTLCLFANVVQLAHANIQMLEPHLLSFITVGTRLLEKCQKYVVHKKSNLTHWHPLLGWFAQSINHE
ncbi:UBE3B [Cordylochernes scorpioides]|uniref:UBE3B n=1 Tax=Cordylochernes scorpioides TaxID=51811 RepID=A0ABY6L7A8_9ARAC|nr:UBE3B [Cordylochernes scorpioides]